MADIAYGLDDLVFLVTGGARGIGAATARMAAGQGARVVVTDLADRGGAELAAEITAGGSHAEFVECDVTDEASIAALMDHVDRTYGVLDVLHNNAGTNDAAVRERLELAALQERDWDLIQQVNVRGPIMMAKHALPLLKRSDNAAVVNAASIAALMAHQRTLAYGTSKTAMVGLTRNLAVELARYDIRVNCYCPGVIETDMLADYIASQDDPATFREGLASENLVPRLGNPDEVAAVACFLASPAASFVNAAVWTVDGGSSAWRGDRDW